MPLGNISRPAWFFLLIMVSGCIGNGRLTRRYYKVEDKSLNDAAFQKEVEVYGFVQPEPVIVSGKFVPKTIFDLTPEGQKALIKTYGAFKDADPQKLLAELREPLTIADKELKGIRVIDMTNFTRIITLTSRKMSVNEADRISSLDIALKSSNDDLVFTGCDKIVTNYVTADLGKLTLTRTITGQVGGSLGLNRTGTTSDQVVSGSNLNTTNGTGTTNISTGNNGVTTGTSTTDGVNTGTNSASSGTSSSNTGTATNSSSNTLSNTNTTGTSGQTAFTSGVNGSLTASRSFYEEVGLRQRYINLSAYIADKKMHFYQEGITGVDVSGNIIASVSLKFVGNITELTAIEFPDLFEKGLPVSPTKISTNHVLYSFPAFSAPVTLTISYNGILRRVTKRAGTISESDDNVIREEGKVDAGGSIELISREAFTPTLWYICLSDTDPCKSTLSIEGPADSPEAISGRLNFNSYENALEFFTWLKKSYKDVAANGFKIGPTSRQYILSASDNESLTIKLIQKMRVQISGR